MKKRFLIVGIILCLGILVLGGQFLYQFNIRKNNARINELVTKQYISELHHLNLKSLKLEKIPNICGIITQKQADDIWSIDLGNNNLTGLSTDLSCLKNLSELNLSFNQLKNIDNLQKLTFLTKVDLAKNALINLPDLSSLSRLQDLHLGYNQITSTKGLEKLTNLTSLQLQHNALEDISAVGAMTKLETLKLEYNKLTDEDIAFLPALTKLKVITVAENAINPDKVEELNQKTRGNM